ncbi:uncharacterized protein LOC109720311 isoform X2 [Ananas comosus]|uniref:GPI inositol-deacylase n=1 Tax=Ananas comosus TaxID=4615 RepID=A0A6P5GC82_ANACO|nr:uncharacterized protein LOC109720311 isoform X2 [Ananas comosus]
MGFRAKCKVGVLVIFFVWIALTALYGLMKPIPNGCIMTYMYPTYIPIATPANVSSDKYGLFLYHEGWKQIDFAEHIKKISGVPVLFIPGNGGSYKQVRSLAAESFRAYQGGPLEATFYQEASIYPNDLADFTIPAQYSRELDWFAVDLEGEHSAMDGQILEEHTEYVVYAIHRILDQYQESRKAQLKDGVETSVSLPTSVILVGHSMGGFVARAAIVHPHLRKSAVETIITLSSPHQSPPVALQPSLGHFFSKVNGEWRQGYEKHSSQTSSPKLSNVIVVSVSGGIHDYQVRSKLASLDGIVPSSHGFTIGSSGMKNVWLSMEHQTILWCNQLVVQMSHSILSMIDPTTGQPFSSTQKRLFVFTRMLQSAIPQALSWTGHAGPSSPSSNVPIEDRKDTAESQKQGSFSCPSSVHWADNGPEKDLYIQSNSVTVLAMDGRRRWLDIKKLGSNGRGHFVFVTNLAPCSGVRIHLWPEKSNSSLVNEAPASKRIIEVTSKMVQIPAGPAPRQVEPGSQTEQPPPSAFLLLGPEEMSGFRFLTIAVAPRPTVSGRPPPAASMAVGQFFNPKEGEREFSFAVLLRSSYVPEEIFLKEDHPLALNLSFPISLGLLPVALSLKTAGCGIKTSGDDAEHNRLCKLRCFPPVALAWDSVSGLHVIPNIYSETITVDSLPAIWDFNNGPEKTIVLLLADPHCSYRLGISVSSTAAASRFFLLYSPQIIGFMIAAMFFALMRQAYAWELDSSVPSILSALEFNLRIPQPFLLLYFLPILLSLAFSIITAQQFPSFASFLSVSLACYLIANGCLILLILSSKLIFYTVAIVHVFIKRRWQACKESLHSAFLLQILNVSSILNSLKIVQIIRDKSDVIVAFVTIPLVFFVHPALGLSVLLLSHAFHAHSALCSYAQKKDFYKPKMEENSTLNSKAKTNNGLQPLLPMDENSTSSPTSSKSFSDSQLEMFNYRHGIAILHLLATLMFVPSLVAWLQRIGMGQSFPWFVDSVLCVGVILHSLFGSRPNISHASFALPGSGGREVSLSLLYLLAGYYTFLVSMALAPYKAFYAMAAIGTICCVSRTIERRNRERGDVGSSKARKHSHKH